MKYRIEIGKLSLKQKIIFILCVSCAFTVILWIKGRQRNLIVDGLIMRPDYAQSSEQIEMDIYVGESTEPYSTQLEVQPVEYSLDETQQQFDATYEALLSVIPGNNESLECVTSDLVLPDQMEGSPISLEWYSDNYDLLDSNGGIHNDDLEKDEQQAVCLTVHMEYQEYTAEYQYTILIGAKDRTQQEEQNYNLESAILSAEQENATSDEIRLPDQVEGEKVSYYLHDKPASPLYALLLGGTAIAALIYEEKNKKIRQQKIRDTQLEEDYTGLITKLTLLIGSGMTIRRAWETIVQDYQQCKEEEGALHYVYEEMSNSLNEMRSGLSEESVYGSFGKRCKRKEYLKLGTLLQQNLKKGSRDLLVLLQQESIEAFEERKNRARRKGEEAGTKLLLPMILMLFVVMAIVMIPAFMSIQI